MSLINTVKSKTNLNNLLKINTDFFKRRKIRTNAISVILEYPRKGVYTVGCRCRYHLNSEVVPKTSVRVVEL